MAKGLVKESSLNSIAEAINVLNGTEGTYAPSEMGEAILDAIPTETASGNPIHITDAAHLPAESVVTTLEPIQAGSGDPSPENIRPISGHTRVELTRTGKNLLPIDVTFPITQNGVTIIQNADGSLSLSGKSTAAVLVRLHFYNNIDKFQGKYLYSQIDTNIGIVVTYYDASGSWVGTQISGTIQLNIPSIASSMAIQIRVGAGVDATGSVLYPMLCDEADSTFEPYQGEPHSITFPQAQSPVYGCEVDWTNGVLRVTEVAFTATNFSNWLYQRYANFKALYMPLYSLGLSGCDVNKKDDTLFDKFKTVSNGAAQPFGTASMYVTNNASIVYLWNNDDFYADEASMKQGIADIGGVQFCYPLATPLEIPLTPEIITLLKGENNVWTDAGESEIEYKVDLNSYIQKLIDEASTQASALSVSPLSLGKSAVLTSTDGVDRPIEESEEAVLYDEVKASEDEPIEETEEELDK